MDTSILCVKQNWGRATACALVALWLSACGGGSGNTASVATDIPIASSFSGPAAQPPAGEATLTVGPAQTVPPPQTAAPSTEEFTVNTTRAGAQSKPSIARLKDGSHVIAWNSHLYEFVSGAPSEGVQGVCTQRYGADGKALGGEVCIAPNVAPYRRPVAAALADGGYLIAWAEPQSDVFANTNIWAQRFDAKGVATGSAQQINSVTSGDPFSSGLSAAGLADGGYVVAWTSSRTPETGADIFARRFAAGGAPSPLGPEKRVNTFTGSAGGANRTESAVAALNDGGYVVIWVSVNLDGLGGAAVYAQRYGADRNGGPVGAETLLTNNPSESLGGLGASQLAVASLGAGGYVVAYQMKTQMLGLGVTQSLVVAQPFAADGTALAPQSTVDPLAPGAPIRTCNFSRAPNVPCPPIQSSPAIAALDDGSFVVAWTSNKSSVEDTQAFARRYSGVGAPISAPIPFTTLVGVDPALIATSGGGFLVAYQGSDSDPPSVALLDAGISARYFGARAFRDNVAP